jgi:hypothetical protein
MLNPSLRFAKRGIGSGEFFLKKNFGDGICEKKIVLKKYFAYVCYVFLQIIPNPKMYLQ